MSFFKTIIITLILGISFVNAQVGIGTTLPDPSSILDVTSTNKGLLGPRISLNNVNNSSIDGININADGLMIYNTNAALINGSGVGYYYWNGLVWVSMSETGADNNKWSKTGDAVVDGQFIGSTNNTDLIFRVNNNQIGNLSHTGAISLGFGSAASGINSLALGENSKATESGAVALGNQAQAIAENTVAIGRLANASQANTVILGSNNTGTRVGVGTSSPAATLDVSGEPGNADVLDGIVPPRITGDQLRAKTYTADQNGAIVYVVAPPTTFSGQTINVNSEGLYVFSSSTNSWNSLGKGVQAIGNRVSVYRVVTLADNEYLDNTGLIELEGLIRITVQRANSLVFRPQIINISGANLEVTVTGTTEGATNQIDRDANLTLVPGGFVSPDPDGIVYWGASLSETVTGHIALPNGSFYEIKWLAFPSSAGSNERRIYMSAERLF